MNGVRMESISFFESKRNRILLLLVLLAAGSFLRVWNLGRASYWVDEVNTLFCSTSYNATGRMTMPSGWLNDRAPAFTVIMAWAYRLLPANETGTRLPAALFGVACIASAYGLARRMFGAKVGLMTAFLMTFSHFEVGWSRTGRMYTLFQLLTLFLAYAFLRGFEKPPGADQGRPGLRLRLSDRSFAVRAGSVGWPALFAVVFVFTFYGVHILAGFLLVGLWCYAASLALFKAMLGEGRGRFANKEAAIAGIGLAAGILALACLPGLRDMLRYFLSYTPPWALTGSSAQNRMALFEFLISPQRFPIAVFFFIGLLGAAARGSRNGWLAACLFGSAFVLLSFVFTHRVPVYLFFVYPFFLMLAAFGFVNTVESEWSRFLLLPASGRRGARAAFAVLAVSIFALSPWIRITAHIPFFGDGMTNLAVTPEEWREASARVRSEAGPGDCVVTSLPQVPLAYGLKSDFCLNRAALEQSIEERFPADANGRRVDMYAGAECIESAAELDSLISGRPAGWILMSQFHFENDFHTPPDVRAVLSGRLGPPAKTRNGTVLLFRWPRSAEAGR
jgi:hypothetical protein